jgi:hypothetical protein
MYVCVCVVRVKCVCVCVVMVEAGREKKQAINNKRRSLQHASFARSAPPLCCTTNERRTPRQVPSGKQGSKHACRVYTHTVLALHVVYILCVRKSKFRNFCAGPDAIPSSNVSNSGLLIAGRTLEVVACRGSSTGMGNAVTVVLYACMGAPIAPVARSWHETVDMRHET